MRELMLLRHAKSAWDDPLADDFGPGQFAALLEGVVTRRTEMPLWASLVVILGSLAFLVGYFVVLPALRGRASHA